MKIERILDYFVDDLLPKILVFFLYVLITCAAFAVYMWAMAVRTVRGLTL